MKKYLFILLLLPTVSLAEISRNNTVDWIVVSSQSNGGSYFIQWQNLLQNPSDCIFGLVPKPRVKISSEDKDLYSMFLAAKMGGKKIGFYYTLTTSLPDVAGHGSGCQITNAWLESD